MEEEVGTLLKTLGLKLAIAESVTGGRLADRITSVPGSSEYFLGAVVAYDNQAKVSLLGVSLESLERFGAVSPAVALEMAQGARKAFGADIAVSSTGIAGPAGATPQKPVGLVIVASATPRGARSQRLVVQGSREENKEAFARAALSLLKEELEGWRSGGQ